MPAASQRVGFASVSFESASAPSEASEHRQKFGHLRVHDATTRLTPTEAINRLVGTDGPQLGVGSSSGDWGCRQMPWGQERLPQRVTEID